MSAALPIPNCQPVCSRAGYVCVCLCHLFACLALLCFACPAAPWALAGCLAAEKAEQSKAGQGKARQGKARQGKASKASEASKAGKRASKQAGRQSEQINKATSAQVQRKHARARARVRAQLIYLYESASILPACMFCASFFVVWHCCAADAGPPPGALAWCLAPCFSADGLCVSKNDTGRPRKQCTLYIYICTYAHMYIDVYIHI